MYTVVGSFVCGGSSGPVVSAGHAGVDVGASAGLEVVHGFCCLGGVLGVDGGAGAAAVLNFFFKQTALKGTLRKMNKTNHIT